MDDRILLVHREAVARVMAHRPNAVLRIATPWPITDPEVVAAGFFQRGAPGTTPIEVHVGNPNWAYLFDNPEEMSTRIVNGSVSGAPMRYA